MSKVKRLYNIIKDSTTRIGIYEQELGNLCYICKDILPGRHIILLKNKPICIDCTLKLEFAAILDLAIIDRRNKKKYYISLLELKNKINLIYKNRNVKHISKIDIDRKLMIPIYRIYPELSCKKETHE